MLKISAIHLLLQNYVNRELQVVLAYFLRYSLVIFVSHFELFLVYLFLYHSYAYYVRTVTFPQHVDVEVDKLMHTLIMLKSVFYDTSPVCITMYIQYC